MGLSPRKANLPTACTSSRGVRRHHGGRRGWSFSPRPHTIIGEMGLIARQTRSATIQAEIDSVLYALIERLKSENRPLHQALLSYVVTVMTERLSFASRTIGVLRR